MSAEWRLVRDIIHEYPFSSYIQASEPYSPHVFNAPSLSKSQQGKPQFSEVQTTLSPWSLTAEFVTARGSVSQLMTSWR